MERYIGYQIRPVVESEGNDESKDIESFHTIGEAQAKFDELVRAAAWENQGITGEDFRADDVEYVADDAGLRLYWTLYGRNSDGTVEAIADTETEARAISIMERISGIAGVPGTEDYDVPYTPELLQGDFMPGGDGSILAVVCSPEDILSATADDEDEPTLTLDQARAYPAEHRGEVSDAMVDGWYDVLTNLDSLTDYATRCREENATDAPPQAILLTASISGASTA